MLGMAEYLRSISTILEWRGVPPVSKSIKFTKTISCKAPLVAPLAGCSGSPSAGCIHEPTSTRKSGSSIYAAVYNMLLMARTLGRFRAGVRRSVDNKVGDLLVDQGTWPRRSSQMAMGR
jgi:hypothetical protein